MVMADIDSMTGLMSGQSIFFSAYMSSFVIRASLGGSAHRKLTASDHRMFRLFAKGCFVEATTLRLSVEMDCSFSDLVRSSAIISLEKLVTKHSN